MTSNMTLVRGAWILESKGFLSLRFIFLKIDNMCVIYLARLQNMTAESASSTVRSIWVGLLS